MRPLLIAAAALGALLVLLAQPGDHMHTYLDKSAPYVGAGASLPDGIDGTGVLVAVIDTGVDHTHPDLLGWGPGGKVAGGYNFVREGAPPLDTNGHGTQVAGVIAADGAARGIAPGASILAYKVSENGEAVSPDLIVRAIRAATDDGADIINISLGVNKTNTSIDRAIQGALDSGVLVVAAAGNDGPAPSSIGSPGGSYGAITVGATYNNLTSSLAASLTVGDRQYTVIPMADSPRLDRPVEGPIIHGGYGRPGELAGANGSILVVKRGSDTEGEMLYFSTKERNAADAGARALVIYNDVPGIFLGELVHEFSGSGYAPRIPVMSMEGTDGAGLAGSGADASLHLLLNPDFAAHFSSRGPVSPFYIKPDIMAPGAYINTTHPGGAYNFTSGTSYAAPHVAGAAALLLQKNPHMEPLELRSVLLTTARPVYDARGAEFPVHAAGSGRLDVSAAYSADLVITPPSFAASAHEGGTASVKLRLDPVRGGLGHIQISYDAPGLNMTHHIKDGHAIFEISGGEGAHEGRVRITHKSSEYVVPFILHVTPGRVGAEQDGSRLTLDIGHPDGWSFAKISVTEAGGEPRTVTAVPGSSPHVDLYGSGEYWVEARITGPEGASGAYSTIHAGGIEERGPPPDIPPRPAAIIAGIAVVVGLTGLLWARR